MARRRWCKSDRALDKFDGLEAALMGRLCLDRTNILNVAILFP